MHAVPPLMTGNYMPSGPDVEIDYSKFTYGPKQTSVDESDAKTSKNNSYESNYSVETTTSMPAPVENVPKVVCEPKVLTDALIIEEYESDSDDDSVSNVQEDKEKPTFAFTNSVKHVNTSKENVKETGTLNHCLKVKKHGRNGLTRKGLGYAFTSKACFVCGSFSHLIRDCDFHERRMAKQAAITKSKNKGGSVAFGGSNERITGKGKIKAGMLDFEDIYYVEELKHYNLFSVSQMCDKKNKVLFTDTDCLVLSPDFKLLDENQVLLKIPRQHNMYSFNLKNIDPSGDLACLFAKALIDDSNKWHKRLGLKEANNSAGTQANDDQGANSEEIDLHDEHFVLPIWSAYSTTVKSSRDKIEKNIDFKTCEKPDANTNNTNLLNVVSSPISTAGPSRALNDGEPSYPDDPLMPHLEDIYASPTVQTRSKVNKNSKAYALVSYIQKQQRNNHKDFQHCLFACFLSQIEPKNISQALEDESWVDAMQEELLQFKIQKVWTLVDLPFGKKAIGTKWVYRNKKDERGVVVRNKARLVTQGHRQEEGIDYDEVFALVARIEAIRIFLAFASYMGFIVYQMDVKSAFLYGTIDEEVYVTQPPGFVDPKFPNKVYKAMKALYGLHQAPRAWYATLSTFLEKIGYKRGAIDKTLFIKQDKKDIMLVQVYKEDSIFISQDKYVAKILKKFDFLSVKTASTPIETQEPLVKDEEAIDVDVRLYRYLKGQSKLGLWYPKVSSFDLKAYSDSDYAGVNLDRKSITREAEYVATAHCCGQILWIQNQLLDYRFNITNTKIYIDNESIICIVKNHVFHSKTKYIEIRHHFIRDVYEKKLIQVLKIHTDDIVADLQKKAFDGRLIEVTIAKHSKELASPKQTALGKDESNPLIVY
nr:hypothetical protein [Tanacetum cinerariifolium]